MGLFKILGISFLLTFSVFALERPSVVSVMSYNVENLFDNVHDVGKNDFTYLPLSVKNSSAEVQAYCQTISNDEYRKNCLEFDWNDEILEKKIKNVAKVIKSYNRGKGPDIVALQEVENLNVLNMLNTIGELNYPTVVLLEGPDSRGIDTAILSRFPLAKKAKLNIVDFTDLRNQGIPAKETRGILEATFWVGTKKLTVFSNHWPSQRNHDLTRVEAAKTMMNRANEIIDSAVIALGDFNAVESDTPYSINDYVLNPTMDGFFNSPLQKRMARLVKGHPGTHWYKGKYSFLDHIFFLNRTMKKSFFKKCESSTCVKPLWSTFRVHDPQFALRDLEWQDYDTGEIRVSRNVPFRFDSFSGQGYSDHLPTTIKVLLK